MRSISVSRFKATCLAVIDEVDRTGEPVVITRRGRPVATLGPSASGAERKRSLGGMAGTVTVHGDVVGPVGEPGDWDALG